MDYYLMSDAFESYYSFLENGYASYGYAFESDSRQNNEKKGFLKRIKETLQKWCYKMHTTFKEKEHATKNAVLKKVYHWASMIFLRLSGKTKNLTEDNPNMEEEAKKIREEGESCQERVRSEESRQSGGGNGGGGTPPSGGGSSRSSSGQGSRQSGGGNGGLPDGNSYGLSVSRSSSGQGSRQSGGGNGGLPDGNSYGLSVSRSSSGQGSRQSGGGNGGGGTPPSGGGSSRSSSGRNTNEQDAPRTTHDTPEDGSIDHKKMAEAINLAKEIKKFRAGEKVRNSQISKDPAVKKELNNERDELLNYANTSKNTTTADKIRKKLKLAAEAFSRYCDNMIIS